MNNTVERSQMSVLGSDLAKVAIGGALAVALLVAVLTGTYALFRYIIDETRSAVKLLGTDTLALFCVIGVMSIAGIIAAVVLVARYATRTDRAISASRETMLTQTITLVANTNAQLMQIVTARLKPARDDDEERSPAPALPPAPADAPRLYVTPTDPRIIDGRPVDRPGSQTMPVLYPLQSGAAARVDLMSAIVEALHGDIERQPGEEIRDFVRRATGISFVQAEYGPAIEALLAERMLRREGGRIVWQMEIADIRFRLSQLQRSARVGGVNA